MNPLVVDKIRKQFMWEKDSGFLYTRQLISSLPNNWRFLVLVPKGFDSSFFGDGNIECIEYDYSTSIHQNRYHFNRNIISKAVPYGKDVDVILNMQPEITSNLKVFFKNQRRETPIIVNYFHWIDCEESRKVAKDLGGYIWRQVEGANGADLNMFHTYHAMKMFMDSMVDNELPLHEMDSAYFKPQPTDYGNLEYDCTDKKIILFNHRLNNTTGWREVLEAFQKLDRDDAVLWFTDQSNLKVMNELKNLKNVHVESIPFSSYGYILNKAHFTVCNIKGYATWNMAVLDSLHHGTEVVSCDTPLMREFKTFTTDDFVKTFNMLLDKPKIFVETYRPDLDDFNLKDYLEKEIEQRVEGKNPAKYEDYVLPYILSRTNPVEKREWVNKFWSFHANSNFQLIRWKLLTSKFLDDDTTSNLTTYVKIHNT